MLKTKACVLCLIISGLILSNICIAGQILLKDKDGVYGANGIVYMFNSEASYKACQEEIRTKGGKDMVCHDLSIPIDSGTKALSKNTHGGLRYVIIMNGPHQGEAGFIGINNYLDVD